MTESGTCLVIRDGETYERWCRDHPRDYVANVRYRGKSAAYMIHRSSCDYVCPKEKGDGVKYTEVDDYKVCSASIEDLVAWGETNGMSPERIKSCGCLTGVVLSGDEVLPSAVKSDIGDGAGPRAELPSEYGAREAEGHDAVIEPGPGESAEVNSSAASVDARKVEDCPSPAALKELARLLHERNEVGRSVTAVIGRPMQIGHVGEYIASGIFDIELCESAVTPGIDGYFRSGPLADRSVNVKFYAKHESILAVTPGKLPDYYLVLTGSKSAALSSRGIARPWIIRHVYLFDAADLVRRLEGRVKFSVATSVKRRYWDEAEIYPGGSNPALVLDEEQRGLLKAFDGSREEIQGG